MAALTLAAILFAVLALAILLAAATARTQPESNPDNTPTPSGDGAPSAAFEIKQDRNWTWITFGAKPAEAVRENLKANGARWSSKRSAWYVTRPATAAELGLSA